MLSLPTELARLYDTLLERTSVAVGHRPHYKKWLRFYWDFCHKYAFEPMDRQSFAAFHEKLRTKNQSEAQCKQAYHAVSLYYETVFPNGTAGCGQLAEAIVLPGTAAKLSDTGPLHHSDLSPSPVGKPVAGAPAHPRTPPSLTPQQEQTVAPSLLPPKPPTPPPRPPAIMAPVGPAHRNANSSVQAGAETSQSGKSDSIGSKLTGASWVSVYDRLNSAIKVRHYSPKTLAVYKHWTQKFQTFTKSKDPQLLSMEDVKNFFKFSGS